MASQCKQPIKRDCDGRRYRVEHMDHHGDWMVECEYFYNYSDACAAIYFTLEQSRTIRQARLTDTTTGLVEYF